ncbi:hypothetical protein ACLB2K_006929 [Fragaria x ananassa]
MSSSETTHPSLVAQCSQWPPHPPLSKFASSPPSLSPTSSATEKHLPFELKLVDLPTSQTGTFLPFLSSNLHLQKVFLKINPDGKVPLVNLDDKWIADSDIITQILEDKYPESPLTTPPDKASVGSKIFSTFIGFLKSKDPKDGTEQALINELSTFNDYLKLNGPFVNGDQVSSIDLSLAPKLYHMEIALGHYKSWSVPDSLPFLKSYIKSIFSRDSFTKTSALKEDVIAGWRPKVLG